MRPTPAGRGGTARCCSPYNAILERLDTMDARIQQAVDDANAAMSAAVIQAGNAAQSASDALTQAGIAAGKASNAAADAADAAQDAADAAQALSDINDTISTVLTTYLGGKVDKLTTAGLHLYSHTGATQGEEEPIDGTTANSIPIRDGNGRMQAADPASGATDKTLVTANWISQSGGSKPNNVIHNNGNEDFRNDKSFGTAATPDVASLILWSSGAYRRFRMRSSVDDYSQTPASNVQYGLINYSDKNDQTVCNLLLTHKASGGYRLDVTIRKSDGTNANVILAETS